jgi:hypothetical protein
MQVAGNEIVDLVIGQISLFLACIDELLDVVFKSIFYGQSEFPISASMCGSVPVIG